MSETEAVEEVAPVEVDPMKAREEEVDKLEDVFEHLYEDCPGHAAKMNSRKERDGMAAVPPSLTYGEVLFRPFAAVMYKLYEFGFPKPNADERTHKFVDLGSGTGRPVFAAALCHPFDFCVGYEILEGLSNLATNLKTHWDEEVKNTAPKYAQTTEIELHHGDFLEMQWSDADVVFINSTCYDDELLAKLEPMLDDLQKGAFVVTTTKPLKSYLWQMIERSKFDEAWGSATVFIHTKIRDKETEK
jgi:hypothetical protein